MVVSASAGNFGAVGPASVAAGTLFDLTLSWDEPGLQPGKTRFGAVAVGTDAGNPGNLGTINVELTRLVPVPIDSSGDGRSDLWLFHDNMWLLF